jgi:hypothetical protein
MEPSDEGFAVRHRIAVVGQEYPRLELPKTVDRALAGVRVECDDAQAQPRTQRSRYHVANQRRSRSDGDVQGCECRPSIKSRGVVGERL